ncbi:class I SAM-dependent methyltransferase [Crocinitomix algicola]|uniref:class I SAM-dependent methyltransferase n=1 Tax=Crocinitomix algicola TaxID=1740263 RepID=UPI000833C499|nr:class I SAM-dependent methyltransferase [Crocinitomix algicola]
MNFWERHFREKKKMWGLTPANSALIISELFNNENFTNILIPGFGYGRNALPFLTYGAKVTGIEISESALNLRSEEWNENLKIHLGSVSEMPFDKQVFDGIYCHGLIHLLDQVECKKFINACYNQLKMGGIMTFTGISKHDLSYGKGEQISEDRFETHPGVYIQFFDLKKLKSLFSGYGIVSIEPINEGQEMFLIKCLKE